MTMRERIEAGKLFTDYCEGLPDDRLNGKKRMIAFNDTGPEDVMTRFTLAKEMFGSFGRAWIEPPLYFCYGTNIFIGDGVYINFNCNFVDDGKITIGNGVMFGPAVTIATVGHPLDPDLRKAGYMYCDPVSIGDNCWIGAGAIICPGVTIGENSIIGAGSIVVHDIPPNSVAVGNPCRVLRQVGEQDKEYYYKDRKVTLEDLAEEAALRIQ